MSTATRTGFTAEGVVRQLPLVASTNGVVVRRYCPHCYKMICEAWSVEALVKAQPRIWEHESRCVEDVGEAVKRAFTEVPDEPEVMGGDLAQE